MDLDHWSPSLNMDLEMPHQSVALIVGVTGMTGLALAEALKKPTALGGPWKVYGSARRPKPSWFPSSITDDYIIFDATSFDDTVAKIDPVASEITHVFWIAIQVRESEEANVRVNQAMLANVLDVLKSTPNSRLSHVTLQTGTQYYMGPVHFNDQVNPHDPPFLEDLARLPYPNFYYPLEDLVASHAPALTYSVHRASIIIGASSRSAYNALLTLAVYATICRREGLPFKYPGTRYTWEHFCDMTDVRVLADQHIWAAVTGRAKNQAFNCTNGDLFKWKSVWKVLSEIFGVGFVPFDESEEFDIVELMKDKGVVWNDIVEQHGLVKTKLEEITCFGALQNVLHFKFQHVCSMNKSREFGFFGFADSLKSLGLWSEKLREMKIIP
ncbi:3-oxo-Delta(4 5)-steroid 5-beta-reductase-like [Tripterygium wilfordii]|uniref:3-oxo-Delta(4 5)-steroid 5-beta-reductase-like n=1 Tax=Tripterygium wilfordii TaxID=458696 RepID=A0A7J7CSV2_TRIWF|nr:(S)-8-oxocitronellyl enol synthase CYC2-like [Tripterygium wilfordii]KAF5737039.1 3-oxo-Delta(4 5)-steroid 5-beta-reductase-like [Tripterygium wilfordii]